MPHSSVGTAWSWSVAAGPASAGRARPNNGFDGCHSRLAGDVPDDMLQLRDSPDIWVTWPNVPANSRQSGPRARLAVSYPAISLTTATAGRHRRPQKHLQTAANLQSTRIRARTVASVTSSRPFRYPCAVHRWIRVKSAAVERKKRPHRPLPGFPAVLTGTMCWPASIMRLNESAATQTVSSSPTCSIDLMYLWPVRATPAW